MEDLKSMKRANDENEEPEGNFSSLNNGKARTLRGKGLLSLTKISKPLGF